LAKGRDIPLITQAEANELYLSLRSDLVRLGYAAYVIELLDRFTYEEGENPGLFRLLVDTLSRLDRLENPAFAVRYYEIRLLDLVGFRPQLFQCVGCNAEIRPEDQFFSSEHGGVLCPSCGRGKSGTRPISVRALHLLRHLQRSSFTESQRLPLTVEVDREVEQLIQHYVTYLLERSLNTPAFLRRVRSNSL
jgi:DNA repair protein RecO (recombination protein O)